MNRKRPLRLLSRALLFGGLYLGGKALLERVWRYRDPARTPPGGAGLILSPADGLVTHIRRIERGRVTSHLLGEDLGLEEITGLESLAGVRANGWLIGIWVGTLDVRFLGAPFPATLERSEDVPARVPGTLFSPLERLQLPLGQLPDVVGREAYLGRGRHTMTLESERLNLALVAHLDRDEDLRTTLHAGERVRAGTRLGFLEKPTLLELALLREDVELSAHVGERVQAGLSVLGRLEG